MTDAVILAPGDVVLVRSGGLLGWAISVCTCTIAESRTKASHTGIIVEAGPIERALDFVTANPDVYREVVALGRLSP